MFNIRHSNLNIGFNSIFDIQHSNLNAGFSLLFDIQHSKFERRIQFDIRYSTFKFECWI